SALVGDVVQDDPSKRSMVGEVVARFCVALGGLSSGMLRSRAVVKNEGAVAGIIRNARYWRHRTKLIALGVPPIP
ncbi:hypothetical protein BV22DRAFT_975657, partial [Leucogyrophana mollusca]